MKSLKFHIIGVAVIITALFVVGVPFGSYFYHYRDKMFLMRIKKVFTLRDLDNAYADAREGIERGLYDRSYKILKIASDRIMGREFACKGLTDIGDILYSAQFVDPKKKYKDALFFYSLAGTREQNDGNEMWRYFQIANCHKYLDYDLSAIEGYRVFLKGYPDSPHIDQAKLDLSSLLIKKKKVDEAHKLLMQLIDQTNEREILSSAIFELSQLYIKRSNMKPENKVKK